MKFKYTQLLGVIDKGSFYERQVNLVEFPNGTERIDVRQWAYSANGKTEYTGKGVILNKDQAKKLIQILTDYLNQ